MNPSKALLQRFLPPICAALLIAAAFFPYKEQKHRLRIVPGVWPAAEPVLLAGDLQILPANHFQVIEIPWSSAVMRAFGSGAADVAVVTLDSALRMRDAGQKLKVLMVLSQSNGADAVLARAGIERLADLKGKRVGVERSAGSYLLVNALESAGMTLKDIESVPMFQSEMETALQTNLVDAVVATDPWLAKLSHNGMHSVYDSSQLKVPIVYLLVASDHSCTASHEELVSLLQIQAGMAAKIWTANAFPGIDAVLRREKMNADELAACLKHLHSLSKTENAVMLKKLPQMAGEMEEQMIRHGIITSRLPESEWINPSFSEEAFH
jgi:NitT/TauT family transport system substrate-binding protein